VLTADTVAKKLAVVAPAATVTDEGTVTVVTLLARLTTWPPVPAAAFSATVQETGVDTSSKLLSQLRPLTTGCPVPVRVIVVLEPADELVVPVDELLISVTVPFAVPPAEGAKLKARVAVWPGFKVSGKLTPEIV
jgi:hypothetical protein